MGDTTDTLTEKQQAFRARFSPLPSVRKHLSHLPFSRVLRPISSMSVRYKIAATLIVVLALAIASLGMMTFAHQKRILQQETQKRAAVLVQHLVHIRNGRGRGSRPAEWGLKRR